MYCDITPLLNKKIWIGLSVVGLVTTILILTFSNSLSQYIDTKDNLSNNDVTLPLSVNLEDISVLSVSNNNSILEIKFKIHNPNPRSVILQLLKYELYGNDVLIDIGQIGERIIGMMSSSNYFTILNNNDIIIKDKVKLQNNDQINEVWDHIIDSNVTWHVTGKLFFNLSSMTSGEEHEIDFELYK